MKKFLPSIATILLIFALVFGCKYYPFQQKHKSRSSTPTKSMPKSTSEPKLLFRSGFEEPVKLEEPKLENREWVQFLRGADQGFTWPDDLSGVSRRKALFTYLVNKKNNPRKFITTRIESVTGHNGESTRALFMETKGNDFSIRHSTRNQFGLYPNENFSQAYIRYWIKFQPDLEKVMPAGTASWRQVMEWKETGPPRKRADYRYSIAIRRGSDPSDKIEWIIRSRFGDLGSSPVDWEYVSKVPVPIGEWFLLEVFWKHHETDGRLWAAVNGQIIADHRGRTKKDSFIGVWWPFKVYAGSNYEIFKRGSLYQWIDDVEIYRDFPKKD